VGYPDRPADSAWHFRVALDYLHYISDTDPSPGRWGALDSGRPAALYFFYREAAEPLVPGLLATAPYAGFVETSNPPPTRPGMAAVGLDGQGRLLELLVVPTAGDGAAEPAADWKPLLAAAGLPDDMAEGELRWLPPVASDRRAAWDGAYPERPGLPIHVE